MSEVEKKPSATRARRAAKPTVEGSDQQTVAENTPVPAAQAEPEQVEQGNENEVVATQSSHVLSELSDRAVSVLGAFKVLAKSDGGFWRSGIQFHRQQETLVLVVGEEPHESARVHAKDYEPERVVFLSAEKAQRVHREPNLTIEDVELADVIELSDTE